MGANQSSNGGSHGGAQTNTREVQTCYYELLGVDRQATDEDIKKAYRRKALALHPDRNYGHVEETTKLFAEVQSAYEVLSDPQERAWYDSHRSALLRGQSEDFGEHYEHNVRITTSEDIMKMFTKLNGRVDFSDSTNGFFTVLRGTFDTLAKEEELACEWEGLEPVDYPSFGHATDNYEEVVRPFYATWNGFATKKTFSWKDVYRCSDAPDRRVRRLMEKENKRFREDGIREFNETVKSLVQFVRKRDLRYIPNSQTEAERQQIIRDAANAQAARSRAANRAKAAQQDAIPAWTRHNDLIEEEVSEEEEDEEKPEEQFECVVCRKTFKSEKQFEAHERSKKHFKAVQQLQREMRNDNQALNLENRSGDEPPGATKSALSTDPDNTEDFGASENDRQHERDMSDHSGSADTAQDDPGAGLKIHAQAHPTEEGVSAPASDVPSASSTDDDYVSRDAVEKRILGDAGEAYTGLSTPQSGIDDISTKPANGPLNDNETDPASQPIVGKARAKRARKAAQQNTSSSTADFKCAACNAGFPSKSRLFNHIKDFGHAQPVLKAAKGGKGKKR